MSQLSNLIHNIAASVEGFIAKAPPTASADLSSAVTQLKGAASALQTALPALAEQAANNVLDLIPGNLPYVGLEDEFIAAVILALENKKSTAATPVAKPVAPASNPTDPLFP